MLLFVDDNASPPAVVASYPDGTALPLSAHPNATRSLTVPDGTALVPLPGEARGYTVPEVGVRLAYGDQLIAALSDAELTAMAGGTVRDQRMLSAQRVPFRATDDIIVRLAAVMHIEPAAWFARVSG